MYSPSWELTVFLLFTAPAFRWIILFSTVQEPFENSFVSQSHSCILSLGPHGRPLETCSHKSHCPSREVPLLACMFLANNVFLSFWHVPKQSSWCSLYSGDEGVRLISFSLPHPSQFAQICELLREEVCLHVSQALPFRVTDKQAGPQRWTVSCVTLVYT